MTYNEAIELIRINSFNLGNIPAQLIDIRMLRFARKHNIWAVEAYIPKAMKQYWLYIVLDKVLTYVDPITNEPIVDI